MTVEFGCTNHSSSMKIKKITFNEKHFEQLPQFSAKLKPILAALDQK